MTLSCGGIFDYDNKAAKLEELNLELEDPNIWNDAERAQAVGKEKKALEGVGDVGFDLLRGHAAVERGHDDHGHIDVREQVHRHLHDTHHTDE